MAGIAGDPGRRAPGAPGTLDLAIVGAGVSGMAAALEARARGLAFEVIEAAEPFHTCANYPPGKPIFPYPLAFRPAGGLQVTARRKEELLAELRLQAARAGITPRRGRAVRVAPAPEGLRVETRAVIGSRAYAMPD